MPINSSSPSTATKKAAIVISAAILVCLAIVNIGKKALSNEDKAQHHDAPMVTVQGDKWIVPMESPLRKRLIIEQIVTTTAPHQLDLPGIVEADPSTTVAILTPASGRIIELKVKLGDTVKAGQVLARVSSPDVHQAYADTEKARDALDLSQRALQRGESVNSVGANATKDLEQIKSNYQQALAEFNRAQERLKTMGLVSITGNEKDSKHILLAITSPVSGSITNLTAAQGAYINDPTTALMTVANLDHVSVSAYVPENRIAQLHTGQTVEVVLASYPDRAIKGKIDSISAVMESDSHRTKARINLNNADGHLKPNMFANIKLAATQDGKLMVPTSALLMNNDSISVFVEIAPWTFIRRNVTIGSEDGAQVSLLSGLASGERVIVRGGVLIND